MEVSNTCQYLANAAAPDTGHAYADVPLLFIFWFTMLIIKRQFMVTVV